MKIQGVSTHGTTFVPTWNGNDKLPAAEQISMVIYPMTEGDVGAAADVEYDQERKTIKNRVSALEDRIFANRVVEIKNLVVVVDGKDLPIESGDAWLIHRRHLPPKMRKLYAEIQEEIRRISQLDEQIEKN